MTLALWVKIHTKIHTLSLSHTHTPHVTEHLEGPCAFKVGRRSASHGPLAALVAARPAGENHLLHAQARRRIGNKTGITSADMLLFSYVFPLLCRMHVRWALGRLMPLSFLNAPPALLMQLRCVRFMHTQSASVFCVFVAGLGSPA